MTKKLYKAQHVSNCMSDSGTIIGKLGSPLLKRGDTRMVIRSIDNGSCLYIHEGIKTLEQKM